jgi:hypothetical protein
MLIPQGVSRMAKPAKKARWKRMNLNVEANLHDAFKAATAAEGKKMTDVLLEFIQRYVDGHPLQSAKKSSRED